MSRGKPCPEQLDLSEGLLTAVTTSEATKCDGVDARNYGLVDGLPCAKEFFSKVVDVRPEQVILGGNSSLNMMYDFILRAMQFGVDGESTPWCKLDEVKFLCPVPGYDRHFAICECMGIKMINIPMHADGPDMDMVEKLVSSDASIKGIWCVPKYSNPQGVTYSDDVVRRFAALKPASKDFRIMWDNAYCIHDIDDHGESLLNILDEAEKAGNAEMPIMFSSTSKMSYPGSGIALLAASEKNIAYFKKQMFFQTIGPDKVNQLRHIRFFGDADGLTAHMKKHAKLLAPKFATVCDGLEKELAGTGIANWIRPHGGYFISLDVYPGCAKRVFELMKNAGVTMTEAGATFPYHKDPQDSNLRIAPSFPSVDDLRIATEILGLSVKIAAAEKLLGKF